MELYFTIITPSHKNIGYDKNIISEKNNFVSAVKKQNENSNNNNLALQNIIKQTFCGYMNKKQ